jgi:uncharacterized protein
LKLQPDRMEGVNVISGLTPGGVSVNGIAHGQGIVVPWQGEVRPWGTSGFDALTADDFAGLADYRPELVIFGSGRQLRFTSPALLRTLMAQRIGVETMDTAAACRTYNVLAGEYRKVVAVLLIG